MEILTSNKIVIEGVPSYNCQYIKNLLIKRKIRLFLILVFFFGLIGTVICLQIIKHFGNHIFNLLLILPFVFVLPIFILLASFSLLLFCLDLLPINLRVSNNKYYIEIDGNKIFIKINDKKKKRKIIKPNTKIYYSEKIFFIHCQDIHKILHFDKSMIKEGSIEDLLVYGKKVKIEKVLKKLKNDIIL
ncbi:MAG: hypothetical protein FWE36_07555 [Erysipelotrichales bacterium]|nr:hypothetical protein [Erysipelotrichales bacterium]